MNTNDVEQITKWSEPKEIMTKNGPRMLCKGEATQAFWSAWRANKDELKATGVSCSKDEKSGEWQACWWKPISAEIKAQRDQSFSDSKLASADIDLPRPDGLNYMPFQRAGIRYALARKNVLIADEMGLGKTIQAIGIINSDPEITSAIIVCPKSLKLNWQRELEKWQTRGLTIGIANGTWPETDIVICTYEGAKKYAEQIKARAWGACIVDEAHYIKNPKAQRSKAVKAIKATRKIRMTGTPIVNRPIELYNLIGDLEPSFGSFFSFAKRYAGATQNGFGWDFSGATNLDELQRRLRETIMVRRLKADVLAELPRKIRQIVEVEADSADARRAVKLEAEHEQESETRLASLRAAVELSKAESEAAYTAAVDHLRAASQVDFAELAKLRHDTAVSKIPAVIAHVQNALGDNDNKIIIGIHHHDVADGLMAGLSEFKPVILTGENNEKQRQAAVDSFQNDPTVRVFVGSIQAAGVGITLTASSHVVMAELDWVPGNVSQFEDRAHRIGQTETVLVQHLVLSGSLDARMAHILVSKQNIIDSALDKDHPERSQPAYEPKQAAASHGQTPDELARIAETLTDEQIEAIHGGLRTLAGMDGDFASTLNGVGFSKIDVQIGHSLADRQSLTPKQAALGMKLVKKYHKQLSLNI